MKKNNYLIIIILFLNVTYLHAQDNQIYKECVKGFYKFLLTEEKVTIKEFSTVFLSTSDARFLQSENFQKKMPYLQAQKEIDNHADTILSFTLLKMRNYKQLLTEGLDLHNIIKHIESSSVYNEGWEFSKILELKLSQDDIIYFELNTDTPKQIMYIWLPSGESLSDLIGENNKIELLKRPGIINDKDGYTNIRESQNIDSRIIEKFYKNNVFYYTPMCNSDWWPVYKKESDDKLGYIHKSKILIYKFFPVNLKNEVKKLRGSC